MIRIAVDAMGGDYGPSVTVSAVFSALKKHDHLHISLYGDTSQINPYLLSTSHPRLKVYHACETVSDEERPSIAFRKKHSSVRMALNAMKNNQVQSMVSSGNTGALVAASRYVLKALPGIERPALVAKIPSVTGHSYLLDLGANLECHVKNLVQFALMGATVYRALDGLQPKVALLNVGSEEIKGNEDIREANHLLKQSHLNYIGYVEGDDLYQGIADVIVCNGFVGNVALKTSEGLIRYITSVLDQVFRKNYLTKLIGMMSKAIFLAQLKKNMSPDVYSGGILLGVQGIVVKSHGKSKEAAFAASIDVAYKLCKERILEKMTAELSLN